MIRPGGAPQPSASTCAALPDRETAAGDITEATAALSLAAVAHADRDDQWRAAIRRGLAAGMPAPAVARLAGISKSRVYQIRDGRRTGPKPQARPMT